MMEFRRRVLDDLWFIWKGSEREFDVFLRKLNLIGMEDTFTLKGSVGRVVEFLDVKLVLADNHVKTSVFIKPTDADRYLHRRSDHSAHGFKGIPTSQYRRAVIICSNVDDRLACINYMEQKFIRSGYTEEELKEPKGKALLMDREEILARHQVGPSRKKESGDLLTCVINHDPQMAGLLSTFLKNNQESQARMMGEKRLVISERRNPTTASLLFAKSKFFRRG